MEKLTSAFDDLAIHKEEASYLLLGGLGFIGKNFVEYLIGTNTFKKLVVVDKKHLKLNSCFPKSKYSLFEDPRIALLQRDLSKENDVKPIFKDHGPFDYVIDFAAETRFELGDDAYKRNTLQSLDICAKESAENKVKRFIYISDAFVYASSSKPVSETGKIDPSITPAKYSLAAERILVKIPNLDFVILRPSITYGLYDTNGFATVSMMASAMYTINNQKMMCLWDKDKKVNAVHVSDVVRAIFFALEKAPKGMVFNITNDENLTQNQFFDHLRKIFKTDIECVGTLKSYLAKIKFDSVIAEFNDKHMKWWLDALKKYKINNSPLMIMVYRENMEHFDLCIDGTAFKKLGFSYKHPKLTIDDLQEQLKYLMDMEYFPNIFKN
jgi:nucleoside-diphosphate-sugar epimerase